MIYDLLYSYLYLLFHLVSIVRKKRDVDLIVINNLVTTWSNSSHNINLKKKKKKLLHCVFIHIILYIIPNYKKLLI